VTGESLASGFTIFFGLVTIVWARQFSRTTRAFIKALPTFGKLRGVPPFMILSSTNIRRLERLQSPALFRVGGIALVALSVLSLL
jgi:hypothetical protein